MTVDQSSPAILSVSVVITVEVVGSGVKVVLVASAVVEWCLGERVVAVVT